MSNHAFTAKLHPFSKANWSKFPGANRFSAEQEPIASKVKLLRDDLSIKDSVIETADLIMDAEGISILFKARAGEDFPRHDIYFAHNKEFSHPKLLEVLVAFFSVDAVSVHWLELMEKDRSYR